MSVEQPGVWRETHQDMAAKLIATKSLAELERIAPKYSPFSTIGETLRDYIRSVRERQYDYGVQQHNEG